VPERAAVRAHPPTRPRLSPSHRSAWDTEGVPVLLLGLLLPLVLLLLVLAMERVEGGLSDEPEGRRGPG
jgi:hypothetical protein